jgi:hypothetical protein
LLEYGRDCFQVERMLFSPKICNLIIAIIDVPELSASHQGLDILSFIVGQYSQSAGE